MTNGQPKINPEVPIFVDIEPSCTIDVAVAKMLGWMRGHKRYKYIKVTKYGISPDQLPFLHSLDESLSVLLADVRNDIGQQLIDVAGASDSELAEVCKDMWQDIADFAKSHNKDEIITFIERKSEEFDNVIDLAEKYRGRIDKEMQKGESSALKEDPNATRNSGKTHIALASLYQWGWEKQSIPYFEHMATDASVTAPASAAEQEKAKEASVDEKPWLIPDPRDPKAEQPWYTPARHFARQLVKDDPTLLVKRNSLAKQVVQSMSGVGIYKRGGKLPHNPGTVLKAFANTSLG